MLKRTKTTGVALVVAGTLGLLAMSWAGPALAPAPVGAVGDPPIALGESGREPAAAGAVTRVAADEQTPRVEPRDETAIAEGGFDARMRDMLRDHMGITGEEADRWGESMGEMMRYMHGDQAEDMLAFCGEQGGPDARGAGGGMMGGAGGGMMGGAGGGMMGGIRGMMGF
jgi:hypothetical protein